MPFLNLSPTIATTFDTQWLTCVQVHRRLFHDDGKGLDEALNEPGQFGDGLITRGSHYVILDNFINSTLYHRLLGMLITPVQQ